MFGVGFSPQTAMKLFFTILSALLFAPLAAHAVAPTSLKTEFLENPLGLDTAKPRFSWLVEDSTKNAKELRPNPEYDAKDPLFNERKAALGNAG